MRHDQKAPRNGGGSNSNRHGEPAGHEEALVCDCGSRDQGEPAEQETLVSVCGSRELRGPAEREEALVCDCGSRELSLAYTVPVFVNVKGHEVTRVVVADDQAEFGRVVRCLTCDRFWIEHVEPETGVWPAWEFGW